MSTTPHNSSLRSDHSLATYTVLLHETDSYIGFFKKRCEIEDEYQHQLAKLVLRHHDIDRKLATEHPDGLLVPDSSRAAWLEMTTNVQQEASLRRNWIKRIRENVIDPLERFRCGKERTLNRIREELRSSISEHKEYLATVQWLKRCYDRKCEEVAQVAAILDAADLRERQVEDSRQGADWEHVQPRSHPPSDSGLSNPTSPHMSRRSAELPPARSPVIISGATSSALRDTATPAPANPLQAKGTDVLHALRANTNNLIQRLNSRKENKGAQPPTDEASLRPSALRGAKVKREAEDADRDYRKGVFHLETLRLRKEQVVRGARRATEDMVFEMSAEAKETFAYYIDETRIGAVSWISICDHAQHLVSKINPDTDVQIYTESAREEPQEPKVLYENAFTGPCQSLLFGVAINDYCASRPGRGWVPLLVRMCIEEIERRGIKHEGIYRISGKMQSVTQLVHEIEKDEDTFKFDPERHEIYTIAGVLKLYLRQLPQPLFPFPLVERVAFSNQIEEQPEEAFRVLAKRIRRLSPAHQATLKLVCEHLARVASYSQENKMTPSNLGLVFAPVVFLDDGGGQPLPAQAWKDNVMEYLIERHAELFEGLPTTEPVTIERSRSLHATVVNRSRTLSPAARKSLEAVRYDSYSRSGSPQRSASPTAVPGLPSLPTQPLQPSQPALEPIMLSDSPSLQPPATKQAPSSAGTICEQPPKRTFSLRRKKSPRTQTPASAMLEASLEQSEVNHPEEQEILIQTSTQESHTS